MTFPTRTITLRPRAAAIAVLTPIAIVASGLSLVGSGASSADASSASVTTRLTALKPASAKNGWGPYETNRSNGTRRAGDGRALVVNGKKFSHGLGVHSSSRLTYKLDGRYTTFSTYIGVDDEVGTRGKVRFKVLRDGVTVYTSPVMTGRSSARYVSVSVKRAKGLTLVVTPVGATGYDHADWGNSVLTGPAWTKPTPARPWTPTTSSTSTTSKPTTSTSTTTTTKPSTTSTTTKPSSSTTTTTPSSTTTSKTSTATSTTTTAPSPSGFPGAANTGVPAGTALKSSGSITISTPGAVVSGLDITGSVRITASNVTLQRSRVTGKTYNIIEVSDSAKGVTIQDVEINGQGKAGAEGSTGIYGPAKVLRSDIFGVENGISPSTGSVLQDNWIHGLDAPGDPHIDGIQIDGARHDIVVRHNFVDLRGWTQTSTVMIDNYFGPVSNVTVDQNLLLGAGYVVYSDGRFDGGPITGVAFTGNRMDNGHWGYASIDNNKPVWSGNVDHSSGASIQP